MTDLEERLTTALRGVADDAPVGAGRAGAARERRASRRRTTVLTSAAAVAAMVAVVGGVAVLGSSDDSGRPPFANDATPTVTPTPSGRVETWRDVSVTVPADWGYGNLSTWCLDGATEPGTPVVERPGGTVELILCSGPANGYGAQFGEGATFDPAKRPGEVWQYQGGDLLMFPEGAWLGYQRSDDAVVQVVAPSRDVAEQVLGSFDRVTDADAHGCSPHPVDPAAPVPSGQVRLCRYGVDDWLEQSELLSGQDAADALTALEAAPAKGDRMCTMELTGPVILVSSAESQGRVTLDACQGFGWNGAEHDLTSDVLYWMLSPGWSGGVEGDVPMPDQLRQLVSQQ